MGCSQAATVSLLKNLEEVQGHLEASTAAAASVGAEASMAVAEVIDRDTEFDEIRFLLFLLNDLRRDRRQYRQIVGAEHRE